MLLLLLLEVFGSLQCAAESMGSTHGGLTAQLFQRGLFKNARALNAFQLTDRAHFVPSALQAMAYLDRPLPVGFNVTISAPHMHAICLDILSPYLTPGTRFLDVGSGSGYVCAAAAHLCLNGGEGGLVVGIDHVQELVDWSKDNITKAPITRQWLEEGKIILCTGDGRLGVPSHAPFTCIHVGAMALGAIPQALLDQLAVGGVLVCPFNDQLVVATKDADGEISTSVAMEVGYVPLTDLESQKRGYE